MNACSDVLGTNSEDGCFLADGTHRDGLGVEHILHDPPLVFDLAVDLQEQHPIDPQHLPAGLQEEMTRRYRGFWQSVRSTLQSTTNNSKNFSDRPCANT